MKKSGKSKGWPPANMKPVAYYCSAMGCKNLDQAKRDAILNPAEAHAEKPDLKRGYGAIKSVD